MGQVKPGKLLLHQCECSSQARNNNNNAIYTKSMQNTHAYSYAHHSRMQIKHIVDCMNTFSNVYDSM